MATSMKVFILILAGAFMWGSFSDDDVKTASSRKQQIDTRYMIETNQWLARIQSIKQQINSDKGDALRTEFAVYLSGLVVTTGVSELMYPYIDSIFLPIGVLIAVSGVYSCASVLHRLRANAESIK